MGRGGEKRGGTGREEEPYSRLKTRAQGTNRENTIGKRKEGVGRRKRGKGGRRRDEGGHALV
jgi:hypothetical protein